MSKADEMFRRLGYYKEYENSYGMDITYLNSKRIDCNSFITFDTLDKDVSSIRVCKCCGESKCEPITMEKLQAIYEKCKELKWI